MKRHLVVALLILFALPSIAQRLYDRKRPEIFPTDGKMRRGGFYVSPGATYTLPRFKNEENELIFQSGDTAYHATFDPNGRLGLYLEAGWFHATWDPVILDYWDFGLAYKQLSGKEDYSGTIYFGDVDSTLLTAGGGDFADRYLALHVNANKLIQTGDYQFVQLSLGANADYNIGSGRSYDGDPFILARQEFPPDLIAQAHFKVGYGFKVTQRLMIIPALETPVFSVVPADQGLGKLSWFDSRYRPLILSVRFLFLRYPKGWACPPVRISDEDKRKHKIYKQEGF